MARQQMFALDLGTTKFCLAALSFHPETNQAQIKMCSVPAEGMHRGMLANIALANKAIGELILKAEKEFDTDVREVSVGIAGSHIKCSKETLNLELPSHRVRGEDLDHMIQMAEKKFLNNFREVLHVIPISYSVDGRLFREEPIGFSGRELTVEYLKVDGDHFYLKDVLHVCNNNGLKVRRFVAENIASASVTITDERKELGVVVADIGGGTTDGIVFVRGKPIGIFTVNIAGRMMTNDLAIALGVDLETAENIKCTIGLLPQDTTKSVLVRDLQNRMRRITWQNVYPIFAARIAELGKYINQETKLFTSNFGAGLVLTGGGSNVEGIEQLLAKITHLRVSKASPIWDSKMATPEMYSPKYATVLGILNLGLNEFLQNKNNFQKSTSLRYLDKLVNWIKELS